MDGQGVAASGPRALPYYSLPPFPADRQISGTAFVIGTGPDMLTELNRAVLYLKGATWIAVNEAIRAVRAHHLVTCHYEKAAAFAELGRKAWPGHPFTVNAQLPLERYATLDDVEGVDYFWPAIASAASSAWGAVRFAKGIGAERVVMIGCPMQGNGYAFPTAWDKQRLGFHDHVAARMRRELEDLVANGEGEDVSSMSGFTRELLGGPAWA